MCEWFHSQACPTSSHIWSRDEVETAEINLEAWQTSESNRGDVTTATIFHTVYIKKMHSDLSGTKTSPPQPAPPAKLNVSFF